MSIKKRKKEHLKLAESAQHNLDHRLSDVGLNYEPFLSAHPQDNFHLSQKISGKSLKHPLWVSSMTGGSSKSGKINKILAKMTAQYGLGMGLGSCRILLENPEYMSDFTLRPILLDQPFWANLGICQVDEILQTKKWKKFVEILNSLEVDGLIVHVNPTQEFVQKDGSILKKSPVDILTRLFASNNPFPIMVKEVGQGFGPKSLESVLKFPVAGIEFGALGGTNFTSLELARLQGKKDQDWPLMSLTKLGHSAKEMVDFWLKLQKTQPIHKDCHVVISGGRGRDILEDLSLAKKIAQSHSFSIGLGYKALELVHQGEKKLYQWTEDYISTFNYLWCYTQLSNRE